MLQVANMGNEAAAHIALLAPVPLIHLESALETETPDGQAAFGTRAWELFNELAQMRAGLPVDVYIYESHPEGSFEGKVTWHARYIHLEPDRHKAKPYRPILSRVRSTGQSNGFGGCNRTSTSPSRISSAWVTASRTASRSHLTVPFSSNTLSSRVLARGGWPAAPWTGTLLHLGFGGRSGSPALRKAGFRIVLHVLRCATVSAVGATLPPSYTDALCTPVLRFNSLRLGPIPCGWRRRVVGSVGEWI
jgi:hypothetical protein